MGRLREELAVFRRTRRESRARLHAKWDAEGVWRPRWWHRLLTWGGVGFGICLLRWGHGAVDRVFGALFVAPGMLVAGAWPWAVLKVLRERGDLRNWRRHKVTAILGVLLIAVLPPVALATLIVVALALVPND